MKKSKIKNREPLELDILKSWKWTVLCIEDHGRMIQINWFKGFLFIGLSVFFLSVITNLILYFLFADIKEKHAKACDNIIIL